MIFVRDTSRHHSGKGKIMMNMKSALALMGLFVCMNAMADQRDQCSPTAFIAKTNLRFSQSEALAFLNSIDQSNFSESKHSLSASGTLPIDVPVQAQGNYDDFSTWWNSYKSRTAYYRTTDQDLTLVASSLDNNGLSAYKACLHGVYGLTVASKLNDTQLVTELFWKSYPPTADAKTIDVTVPVEITVVRGQVEEAPRTMNVGIDSATPVVFPINKGEPITVIFKVNNNGGVAVSAEVPIIHSCSITTPVVTVNYKDNPIALDDQKNNGNVDATIVNGQRTFTAQLQAEGRTNIKMLTASVPEGGHAGHRWYRIYLSATYGGDKVYGPDVRCTSDEPAPPMQG